MENLTRETVTYFDCGDDYANADIVVWGAPFDGTTSFRPGTRFGPTAMRSESYGLEDYSPYQDTELSEFAICDLGDPELPYGNPRRALDEVAAKTRAILSDNKVPVMIGGEHLLTLGAVEAMVEKYPDLRVIHLDAHTDLRDEYLGEKLSHAAVIRRCYELLGKDRIASFGIRSGLKEEFAFGKQNLKFHPFVLNFKLDKLLEEWRDNPIYVTIDLDVLDPSVFPGTGTPEPGGVTFNDLLKFVLPMKNARMVGFDLVELSPHYDASGASTAVACKVLREMLMLQGRSLRR